jgi:hypothetical protein
MSKPQKPDVPWPEFGTAAYYVRCGILELEIHNTFSAARTFLEAAVYCHDSKRRDELGALAKGLFAEVEGTNEQ